MKVFVKFGNIVLLLWLLWLLILCEEGVEYLWLRAATNKHFFAFIQFFGFVDLFGGDKVPRDGS